MMNTTHAPISAHQPVGLDLIGIEKKYGDVTAVADVTLSVQPGEFLTLLGPSGSGKSTTLNMVAGFELPTQGTILLGNRDITRLATHKRGLGMVFQSYALFPHLSVLENVMYPLRRSGGTGEQKKRQAVAALESVSLGHLANRRPAQLSGGQQQRVALARAFVSNPPNLLMDEPLSALDKALRTQMQEEIHRLHQELGTTVLFVTHDQEEALALSDRIVIMRDGAIAQVGSPTEMYESPANRFTASFLGAANFISGIVETSPEVGQIRVKQADGSVIGARTTASLQPGDQVSVVPRPEDCILPGNGSGTGNRVRAVFEEVMYLGDRLRCTGSFADGTPCMAWISHDDLPKLSIGMPIELEWNPSRCVAVPSQEA